MRRARTAFATIFAAGLAGTYLLAAVRLDQASVAARTPTALVAPAAEGATVGLAVYYGAEFAGQATASGEIYDPSLLTAAHPTLPLGAEVQVTNLANGRSAVVRVNDRGPYTGALIDLSTAAAQRIGLLPQGSGQVQLERLR